MTAGTGAGRRTAGTGRARGRVPTRSRREIARAAVALADRDGLDAVTMRAVARDLGTGAASLYRYVRTRDELVALMVEEVNGELDLENPTPARPWVERMLDLAHQARAVYRRHPWMLGVLETTQALGPNGYAYLDHALGVLAPTGADGRTRLEAVGVFSGLVRLLCTQERDAQQAGRTGTADRAALGEHLAAVASTGAYPHLAAALADAGPADAGPTDDQFDRVLRRALTGLLTRDG